MSSLKTRYLVAYNTAQSLGWLWLLVLLVPHLIAFLSDGWVEGNSMAFTDVKHILLPLQATASLEVIHNLAGWVKSSPVVTLTQVGFRLINCLIYELFEDAAARSPWCLVVLFAWTLTECIRYPFYLSNLVGTQSRVLKWLRYSLFIVLYPLGGLGEAALTLRVLWAHPPLVKYDIGLYGGNTFETAKLYLPIACYMGLFLSMGLPLYSHMRRQRRKVLGDASKKSR